MKNDPWTLKKNRIFYSENQFFVKIGARSDFEAHIIDRAKPKLKKLNDRILRNLTYNKKNHEK